MKLIKSSFEILEQKPGIQEIYKQIEKAGRVSYKSEDKITEDSAKKFVSMLINRGHTSCLEHGTVYLCVPIDYTKLDNDPYTIINVHDNKKYITTNLRVLTEGIYNGILGYLSEPTEYHEKRVSVRFILPISISREFIRHKILCVA